MRVEDHLFSVWLIYTAGAIVLHFYFPESKLDLIVVTLTTPILFYLILINLEKMIWRKKNDRRE